MSDERTLGPATNDSTKPADHVDVPVARAQPGTAPRQGEPTYSEKQVAQILQRTAQLERGRVQQRPELSLAEVEAIAREAGLDPSLVRIAAQSLDASGSQPTLGARIAGAPLRRVFERVIDGELTQAVHEQVSSDLRAALRSESAPAGAGWGRPSSPQIATVGRTLTMSARVDGGVIELELVPRGNKTLLRIDVACGQLAGGLFGGLGGGLGGGMTPALIAGLSANAHLPGPALALAGAAWMGGAFLLARTLFSWRTKATYRRMEKLADQLAERIRDELTNPKK